MGLVVENAQVKTAHHNEFLELLRRKEILTLIYWGVYYATTKILCKCKKCGREWLSLPGHI